jgi:hypothetical protein
MLGRTRFLSGNALKILAAIFMVIDHVGLMFFPTQKIFRIIGRLAFPIFAFMISEGAKYTKNKIRYFSFMFGLAFICQLVYFFFDSGSLYMCILVTFSLSILLIYALKWLKAVVFTPDTSLFKKILVLFCFLALLTGVTALNLVFEIDYGLAGILVPVFASVFDFRGIDVPESLRKLDCLPVRIASLGVGLLLLAMSANKLQFYSLFALILLALYSGKRGRLRMKYFFYLFYPLHLVVLECIYLARYFL